MNKEELRKLLPGETSEETLERLAEKYAELEALAEQAKEFEEKLARYEQQMREAEEREQEALFQAELERALERRGARSLKAAKALLDLEALRQSENRAEAIRRAVEELACSEEGAFLFAQEKTGRRMDIGGGRFGAHAQTGATDAIRRAAGLK